MDVSSGKRDRWLEIDDEGWKRIITALSTQDERIAEQFRTTKFGRRPKGQIVEIDVDVPVSLNVDIDERNVSIDNIARIAEALGRQIGELFTTNG